MRKNIVILLVLFLGLNSYCLAKNKKQSKSNNCCTIAYIDMEALLKQYNRVIDFAKEKETKQEENIATINNRKAIFDKAVEEFKQKIDNNTFLSAEYANREHKRLMEMESNLAKLNIELQQALEQEEAVETDLVQKLIKEASEKYNQTAKFQFILVKDGIDNILIANSEHDVTNYILDILNSQYAVEKKDSN